MIMWELILKIFSVYLSSMLKFIFGPVGGLAAGLNIFVTMVVTIAGMMTVVVVLAYFGAFIRRRILVRFFSKRKQKKELREPSPWRERAKRYGVAGVAFLTPIILTPIGGTLVAIGMGSTRQKIITYMLMSAGFWSFILTLAVYFGADALVQLAKEFSEIWSIKSQ